VLEIVNKVQEVCNVKFEIGKSTPREGDDAKKIANIEKAKQLLGWRPKRTLQDSISSLIAWYKVHPHGWM